MIVLQGHQPGPGVLSMAERSKMTLNRDRTLKSHEQVKNLLELNPISSALRWETCFARSSRG